MASLCSKIFLRRRDTAYSVFVIALLVAILASASSIISFLSLQVEALASLANPAGRYVVVGGGSLSNSRLSAQLVDRLTSLQYFDRVSPGRLLWLNVTAGSACLEVLVRGVGDVEELLRARGAYVSGSVARGVDEAVVGELAARACSLSLGAEVCLMRGSEGVKVRVVGVFRTGTELDSEVVVPVEALLSLTGEGYVSFIELSLRRGVGVEEALAKASRLLPEGVRIVQIQQPSLFAQRIVIEALSFLRAWSLIVCAVVASASYVIAARLVEESSYELLMLRALGARRVGLFALVLLHVVIVATLGSVLGMALGLVGAQVLSTVLSWLTLGVRISPLLELSQAVWILLATVSSAVIGCLPPASKAAKVRYAEKLL